MYQIDAPGVVKVELAYSHPNSGRTNNGADDRRIFNDAVQAVYEAGYVDFATYDTDGDQIVSPRELAIMLVVSGYEASYSLGVQEKTVWAHSWSTGGVLLGDDPQTAVKVRKYTMIGEVHASSLDNEDAHMAPIGTACHELGHDLGLMDYYNTTYAVGWDTPDFFSLMGGGSWGQGPDDAYPGESPVHLDAYSKWYLGFCQGQELSDDATDNVLPPAAASTDYTFFKVGGNNEYFLIENRSQENFDAGLNIWLNGQDSTVVIWHIDENILQPYWDRNQINSAGHIPGIVVEYSGDLNELNLFWQWANNGKFNDTTTPNSRYNNGDASNVAISIEKNSDGLPQISQDVAVNITDYHEEDLAALQDFLAQNSAIPGERNGQRLALLDPSFSYDETALWQPYPGIVWSGEGNEAKRIVAIQWPNCDLAGQALFDGLADLKELDLSGNEAIENVTMPVTLQRLNLAEMGWSSLDLHAFNYLDTVDLSWNCLEEIALPQEPIMNLDLSYNRLPLTDDFLATMAAWYDKQNSQVTYLPQAGMATKYYQADDLKKLNSFLKKASAIAGKSNGEVIFDLDGTAMPEPCQWIKLVLDEQGEYQKVFQVIWQQTGKEEVSPVSLALFGFAGEISPTIDFSGFSQLLEATLYRNGLTSLKITDCANLQYLDVSDNALTSLDLAGNTFLYTLYCQNNQLRHLTLWDQPGAISDFTLDCRNNCLDLNETSSFMSDMAFLQLDPANHIQYEAQRPYASLDKTKLSVNLKNVTDLSLGLTMHNTSLTKVSNGSTTLSTSQYQLSQDGKTFILPKSYLSSLSKGTYTLEFTFADLAEPLTIALTVSDSSGGGSGGGGSVSSDEEEWYTITALAGDGGGISPMGKVKVEKNGNITFVIAPAPGYEIADILVNGKSIGVLSTYTMKNVKANGTIEARFQRLAQSPNAVDANDFSDIQSHWAKTAIATICEKGLMQGSSETAFLPDAPITRGMVVTVLGRLAQAPTTGRCSFQDVPASAYYAPYVAWANEKGIVKGFGNGCFAPEEAVTRQELAVILAGYAASCQIELPEGDIVFPDAESISPWAQKSVNVMAARGIIQGREDGRFDGQGQATRAEFAVMLNRFLPLMQQ